MGPVGPDQPLNREFDALPFERIGDAAFSCHLPHTVLDKLIIELRPRSGQVPIDLTRWLMNASIASASLMPLIQQYRLPGAPRRLLAADEIREQKLPAQALMFELQNQMLTPGGENTRPIFQPDQSLLIQGTADSHAPAAVILYISPRKNQ